MANINQTPKASVERGFNGFNLDHSIRFSSSTGHLLPVFYDLLNPNDKVSISEIMETRTMDIESAAFASINEHIDYFFVPLQQICGTFSSMIYNVNDLRNSLFTDENGFHSVDTDFPIYDLYHMIHWASQPTQDKYENDVFDFCDEFGVPIIFDAYRLSDMLHLGLPFNHSDIDAQSLSDQIELANQEQSFWIRQKFNIMFLCAYHKCYYDFYRDTNYFQNNPADYNLDKLVVTGNDSPSYTDMPGLFKLHYRRFSNDFFTNRFPSPVFSNWDINAFNRGTSEFEYINPQANGASYISPDDKVTAFEEMTSQDVRTAFALDKFAEVNRRVRKNYKDLTRARFGISPDDSLSGDCRYLGSHDNIIQIGQVISTAATEDAALGEVGGKGYGLSSRDNKTIHFTAPCHGIVIGIYSAVPDAYYDVTQGTDKLNKYHKLEDFYLPEFDGIGMQPLSSQVIDNHQSNILGWQYRYSELKSKINRNMGAFVDSLNYWTLDRKFWLNNEFITGLSNLVSPYELDNIMLVKHMNVNNKADEFLTEDDYVAPETNIKNMYAYDPLIHQINFNYRKVSKMSTYSLPQL